MPNRRIALAAISCAAIGFIASSGAALAQSDYPTKPVKIIVPFPAGGTSDVMGRLVAEELGKILKQPFIVENTGGAGGVIGTERGAKAAPDGYTLIQTGVGQSAVAHGLDPNLKYNSITDFVHISQVNSGPNVLVVVSSGGPETRHLVSANVLRELGSQGYLINVSRGSVVDEEALVQALEDGVIAGAGLDVYADEPRVPERLLALEQVVLLPHLASATHETRQAMADLVLENLDSYFATGAVRTAAA